MFASHGITRPNALASPYHTSIEFVILFLSSCCLCMKSSPAPTFFIWGSSSHNEQGLKSNFQEILQEEQRLDPSWSEILAKATRCAEELWLDM
jgi:hypothetical protein